MDVIITNSQFKDNCLKQSCINNFKKKLNTPRTRNTFQKPIDLMLKDIRKVLDPNSEQFKKDADILKTYFNYSDKKVNSLMNIKMVYDDNNDWVPINKLNTNYSDLSILITDILIGEGECICKRLDDLNNGNGSFMLELSNKMLSNPEYYYTKYLEGKFDDYVLNNRKNTSTGTENEIFAVSEMEKFGYELNYMASEGSPIDTKLGVDAIMSKDGKTYKIQIKTVNSLNSVEETSCDKINPEILNSKKKGGVRVYSRNGVYIMENNIDYLILVAPVTKKNGGGKSMIVLRKYQPVTVTLNPLFCVATPINKFPTPKGLGFIDHESIVHKTENLNGI